MKRVYLVRHGQTDANRLDYIGGIDEPLNETGLLQASQLAERIGNLSIDKLVVSNFKRAQQTAEPAQEVFKLEPEVSDLFGEVMPPSYLIGKKSDSEEVADAIKQFHGSIGLPEWKNEEGETFYELAERIDKAVEFIENLGEESVLIVSHSFYLSYFLASILIGSSEPTQEWFNVGKTIRLSNTGISYLTLDEGEWRVVMVNDHAHFAE